MYLPDAAIRPAFGIAEPDTRTIYINTDLPGLIQKFVIAHELYHLGDQKKHWLWREIRANIHGSLLHPFGFCLCVLMSLAPYRLKFYQQRFRQGR